MYQNLLCYRVVCGTLLLLMILLPIATKLRQGNVFTSVFHSVHWWRGVSVPACTTGHMTWGLSLSRGVLFPAGSLSGGSLSRGISVWGVSVQGVSVQGVSVQGGLCPGGVSVQGSLSPEGGLCLGVFLSKGISVQRGVSVWGVSVQGGLSPGERGVSVWGVVSVRETPRTKTPRTAMSVRYASYWNAFLFEFYLRN